MERFPLQSQLPMKEGSHPTSDKSGLIWGTVGLNQTYVFPLDTDKHEVSMLEPYGTLILWVETTVQIGGSSSSLRIHIEEV